MKKKILILGGSHFQTPAIKYARKVGYHVITVDYLPSNPGHKYSNEYYNISTIDKDNILKLSEKLKIDAILSYASDPGATTASYVSEKLGLAGNPYEAVKILQQKNLFREFLKNEGLKVPKSESFSSAKKAKIFAEFLLINKSILIKPNDSSGSKGITKLTNLSNFEKAFKQAKNFSISGLIIVEEFIEKTSYEMDGDGFVWDGKLVFRCFGNQHNDLECNPYVPAGISFPCIHSKEIQDKAHNIVDKILKKLSMKLGGINIEYIIDKKNNIYILEIGPRNGGNSIPEVIRYSTNIDLIAYAVESAMGKDCSKLKMKNTKGYYATYIIHSRKNGLLKKISFSKSIKENIVSKSIWKKENEPIEKFNGSHATIGTMLLKFNSKDEMLCKMDNMNKNITIEVKDF